MNKSLTSIFLVALLIGSLSLVSSTYFSIAQTSAPNPINVQFDSVYDGQATYSNEKIHTNPYCVKLVLPTNARQGSCAIALYPYDGAFNSMSTFSIYISYNNALPRFVIYLDTNNDTLTDVFLISDMQLPSNGQWVLATGGLRYGWDETSASLSGYGSNWQPIEYWKNKYQNAQILYLGVALEYHAVSSSNINGVIINGLGQPLYADELVLNGITYNIEPIRTTKQITFHQNGINTEYAGTVLTVDEQNYSVSQLPITFLWQTYTSHTYSYAPVLDVSLGTRHVWSSTSSTANLSGDAFVVTDSSIITAQYKTQYHLNISSPYGEPSGQGWYDAGSTAVFSISSPISEKIDMQHVFTNWTGIGSGSVSNQNKNNSIVMNAPITENANWKTQYLISFTSLPQDSGTISPSGINQWADEGEVLISATPNSNYTFSGWHSATGLTAFTNATTPSTIAIVSGADNIVAKFEPTPLAPYNITITHVGLGSVSPPDGTYSITTSPLTLTATPAENYDFMCWLENGTQISTLNPLNYNVTDNYIITAVFYDPIPKETPTVTPSTTPVPTATPSPTPTSTTTPNTTTTPTSTPTTTPQPTVTPSPTQTPTPTLTPTVAPTQSPPSPEESPSISPTAEPTATTQPTTSPSPSQEPTASPDQTQMQALPQEAIYGAVAAVITIIAVVAVLALRKRK